MQLGVCGYPGEYKEFDFPQTVMFQPFNQNTKDIN